MIDNSDGMDGIRQAKEDLKNAEIAAQNLIDTARANLGWEINKAREDGVSQQDIADYLGKTRETIRRLQVLGKEMLND